MFNLSQKTDEEKAIELEYQKEKKPFDNLTTDIFYEGIKIGGFLTIPFTVFFSLLIGLVGSNIPLNMLDIILYTSMFSFGLISYGAIYTLQEQAYKDGLKEFIKSKDEIILIEQFR